jgi:hypothetical protein
MELDVSEDVLELTSETRRTGGRVQVTLRNDDVRYNGPAGGPFAAIAPGAELAVSLGFVTNVGVETTAAQTHAIERLERVSKPGEATLTLLARDGWSLLERWRARRQHTWEAGSESVAQILRFVFGRAGLELLDVGSSETAASHRPAFTIHPGEDGLRAAQRLLAMVPDVALLSGQSALLFERPAAEGAVAAYGTDLPVVQARYADAGLEANRVQVFGQGMLAEGFHWPDIADEFDRLRQVHDLSLTSTALAQARASATLRQEELALVLAELVAPVHCGLELYDVISVTDARAGLAEAAFRVAGLDLRYRRRGRTPVYEQRLLLGAV